MNRDAPQNFPPRSCIRKNKVPEAQATIEPMRPQAPLPMHACVSRIVRAPAYTAFGRKIQSRFVTTATGLGALSLQLAHRGMQEAYKQQSHNGVEDRRSLYFNGQTPYTKREIPNDKI